MPPKLPPEISFKAFAQTGLTMIALLQTCFTLQKVFSEKYSTFWPDQTTMIVSLSCSPFPSGELSPHIKTKSACLKKDFLLSRSTNLSRGGARGDPNPYLEVLFCFKPFQKPALQPMPACGYSQTDGIAYGWSLKYYLAINDRGG